MSNYRFQIVSDSCCDLPKKVFEEKDIKRVSFYVTFRDGAGLKDYEDFTHHDFYQRMLDNPGDYPKTSLPSVEDYVSVFEPFAAAGEAVLCLCMTASMSGSYNSACTASEIVKEKYPEAKIEVIDSRLLTIVQGMLVLEACRMRDEGKTLEEAVELVKGQIPFGRAYFTIGDMSYLNKGGRIGGLVKLAAVGLGIKPVILFRDGGITLSLITRNRKKSLQGLAHQAALYFIEGGEDPGDYVIGIGYGLSEEDGREVLEQFKKELGEKGDIELPAPVQLGTMVGAHNGPYLMGIAMIKKYRG